VSSIPDRAPLRRDLRQRRRALSAPARMAAADALATRLLALPWLPARGYVAGYWAMDGEIALHAFQLRLPAQLAWCLPLLDGDHLRFAPWRPGDPLTTNRFGIPEPDVADSATLPPEALSLALMPMVGFDAGGNRLGMGGGWYDRSFGFRQDRAAPPWLVAVGFDEQQVDRLAPAPWDVVPDAICTPTRTLHRP
jgi:5-formyltetrahydrofolate cyclo-ligase